MLDPRLSSPSSSNARAQRIWKRITRPGIAFSKIILIPQRRSTD